MGDLGISDAAFLRMLAVVNRAIPADAQERLRAIGEPWYYQLDERAMEYRWTERP